MRDLSPHPIEIQNTNSTVREKYRETNVESRTGPLKLIVRTKDEGNIGEREDGDEEERKGRRKRRRR